MKWAIETRGLVKEFGGVRAVDELSIRIGVGQITGIIGPNGSGKSTLTNVLTGVTSMNGGVVVVGGRERRRLAAREVLGFGLTRTFQQVCVFEQMSVLDNVLVVTTARGWWGALFQRHGKEHLAQTRMVLERVGLWGKRDAMAAELSYGQRKLLEIARALATEADILLFDEPYAGLFPEMVKRVSGIMRELREQGRTVVLIEHDMAIIRELCDRVVVMDAGKLLAEGTPAEVLADKRVVEAYLGA